MELKLFTYILPTLLLLPELSLLAEEDKTFDTIPPANGQELGHGQFWFGKRVVVDTWNIIASPLDWSGPEWALAGGAVAVTAASGFLFDRESRSESQEQRNDDNDRWAGNWGQLGTYYSLGALGAAGLYGWMGNDERGVDAMVDGIEASIIASGIIAPALKFTVGRYRPNRTAGDSDKFDPFSSNYSFPSGHTTQAFTIASVLAFSFEEQPVVGVTSFLAATGVGLSRIHNDAHYVSDVVAGAIIGTWVGYEVVRYNQSRRGTRPSDKTTFWSPKLNVIYDGDRKGLSFTWNY